LIAEQGRMREILFAPRFMQHASQIAAAEYMRKVATELNQAEAEETVQNILEEVEWKLRLARSAETSCQDVTF
jgi:hypothetical protein